MTLFRFFAAATLALAASVSFAQDTKVGAITITRAQARATVAGQTSGGAFMSLDNQGPADRLLSASAPVGSVEMHTMRMEGDVMHMRQVDAIDLPAGAKVELKPGGMHLMLLGLKAPLKAGDSLPITLRFEKAGEVTVKVPVQAAAGAPAPQDHKQH